MTETGSRKPLTGRMVLMIVLTFFGTVIGVNATMMTLAIRTLPGTEVDSAYAASLAYNKEIRAMQEQAGRHWAVQARVARTAAGGTVLTLQARDRNGAPIDNVNFSAVLERPATTRDDVRIDLQGAGGGTYKGVGANVAAGQWVLVLEGSTDRGRQFSSRNRIVIE